MENSIRELVTKIEAVIASDLIVCASDRLVASEDDVRNLFSNLSFPYLKELEQLYPCLDYLLYHFKILSVNEIYEYHKMWKDQTSDPRFIDDVAIELVSCLIFADYKDLYYAISKDGKVYYVAFLDPIMFPISKDLRSFLNAFADTYTYLYEHGLYNKHVGINPGDSLFRQMLRKHNPELVESTIRELDTLKNDPDLSIEKILNLSWPLLDSNSANTFFSIAENVNLDDRIRENAREQGEFLSQWIGIADPTELE
ncbi:MULTISPECIES: hypothetical protein [Pseudanabaena]|uniref:Uncharacterized protein n=2 Tax=Pseudanabaena TaxID=1152 RepID=L8MVL2_9CYAN|nr:MULTISPECIES: hypothetical protein [Pseudanabaena]ELS31531.1 hypothetical protein Pse7429DRAFT_3575 [Pseudanabaena biceps PCC 7429]MDG3496207.1 hypothetical protein [Pseudanabaena catenata USMAC16]